MLDTLNNYLASQGMTESLNLQEELMFDIETYPNYFLISFIAKGNYTFSFEMQNDTFNQYHELAFVCLNFVLVGYNSNNYDIPMLRHLLSQKATNHSLYELSVDIIENEMRWQDLATKYEFNERIKLNTYDIMPVAPDPSQTSLKMYSARLLSEELQDLPYPPHIPLKPHEIDVVRKYCIKDIRNTYKLRKQLSTEIEMRYFMGQKFGMDLRSLSDAQIGERVTISLIEKRLNKRLPKPMDYRNKTLRYFAPCFIEFSTPYLQHVLDTVNKAEYLVGKDGSPKIPSEINDLAIRIGDTDYKLGIGGLHSQEKAQTIICDENHRLRDVDVDSFYPRIILNNRYAPQGIEEVFLQVYEYDLVNPRLEYKHKASDETLDKDTRKEFKKLANSNKIVINGLYGKLGSPYSKVYAPQLMISVCLTGQLSLLMLIERLELAGIKVVSGNTDGIVIYYNVEQTQLLNDIVKQWEKDCNFTTEHTYYHAIYSANVNNYIAVKSDENCQIKKGCKRKGIFADHWFSDESNFKMKNTPSFLICRNAVVEYLMNGTPLEVTIGQCKDIRQFLSIRRVKGGGTFRGKPFGRIARFYIGINSNDCLRYATTGNKVSQSDNAELCLDLPKDLPFDLNYQFYIDYANRLLYDIGYKVKNRVEDLF